MIRYFHSTARMPEVIQLDDYKKGCWIELVGPDEDELSTIAQKLDLDIDLLSDAMDLYEAPRLEIDGNVIYCYTRYYHVDDQVINATEPILFVYHPDYLLTITRIDSKILSKHAKDSFNLVTTQRTKLLLQFMESVNHTYQKYVNKTTRHILKVRTDLKTADLNSSVLLGLVEMSDDLNEVLSALQSHGTMLRNLLTGKHIRMFEDDKDLIEDLSLSSEELIELVKSRLKSIASIRQTYDALATAELNRTFKRLTSISIFLMVPAIFAGLYGMNVLLPFQSNGYGFWIVIALIIATTLGLVAYFNRKHWI